ncbi:MAG TPA: tRNA uridine-5-carboxymethylaminomethyl(34) synthesis enzyme MnmG [Patescibacteria group bacterium]|jgi:tRNA uridine 5-carboxymethylaminomethyl modification enzyme|nr:tRNA uridine-5-carboxymethylaminomethyl(34) synthesis enzyme MnmG [Patescibacteria group bacterium]
MQSNKKSQYNFDVIVVGGGHAGIEAAYAASKMGSKTALITLNSSKIGCMPCNPAVGGVGKGHIVYEIAALGGLMPKLCSQTYLQARMLNTKKGPAVQGLRLQIDKHAYSSLSQHILKHTENLSIVEGTVGKIILDQHRSVKGIVTDAEQTITAPAVVLSTGTFLNGLIHIGNFQYNAGRREEEAVKSLSPFLLSLGLKLGRLKTGTPPRLLRSSLCFEKMERQEADKDLNYLFEFHSQKVTSSHDCYITHTNQHTHDIIKKNLHRSAMYSGNIKGIGPRYCPSIEDKIGRFPDKQSHHVFVEPEGASVEEMYPNGLSTSLPFEVQKQYIQSIVGFEDAVITKPGYAVEYDFVLPDQLHQTLEVKSVPGLFLAGQINGTTGYEEAAGQGLVAGINAHLKSIGKDPFILDRTESYIGVMVDDLTAMGIDEPYRMFTSRAERRLLLRQDNTFLRLSQKAYNLGLINESLYQSFSQEKQLIEQTLASFKVGNMKDPALLDLFGKQEFTIDQARVDNRWNAFSDRALSVIHAEILYGPYLEREELEVKKTLQYKHMHIPTAVDFNGMPGLSKELQQKLTLHKPTTIAQAALIPGMTPAAISLLIFKIRQLSKT